MKYKSELKNINPENKKTNKHRLLRLTNVQHIHSAKSILGCKL